MKCCSVRVCWWLLALASLAQANASAAQLRLTILHSFRSGSDGQQPEHAMVEGADGALYGTTFMGGTNRAGTVFKVNLDGSGNTPIYHFPNNPVSPFGLSSPSGLIQGADGVLYGTDANGGSFGWGSVFRLNPDGPGFTILRSFNPAGGAGYGPGTALVQGRDGYLFGTTQGGGVDGSGTIFKMRTDGTGFVELHAFGAPGDGRGPMAPLIQGTDGSLYGTTVGGGASAVGGASGYGSVFRINTDGSGETVLHSFMPSDRDGRRPYGALVQGRDGTLYGVTSEGGAASSGGSSGFGTIFRINPNGSGYAIIHDFDPGVGGDGKYPWAGMEIGNDEALYGTTQYGGSNNMGVLFRHDPRSSSYSILYTFGSSATDGQYPRSRLVRAHHGGLFATAPSGGDLNYGVIFRVAPAPAVITGITPASDKSMEISLTSAPYFDYLIEASSDQIHWTALTNVYNATGIMKVTDPSARNLSQRYYRAGWVP